LYDNYNTQREVSALHNRIREVRQALGLTQREFGEKLWISRDVVGNIEYGRVKPKDLLIGHICKSFGVNEHWLRTGEGEMFGETQKYNKKIDEAVAIFQTLRPEFQDYALEQIRGLAKLEKKI